MSNSVCRGQWRSGSSGPLCRTYLVLVPRLSQLAILDPSGLAVRTVHWGIGQLSSGEAETVGAWSPSDGTPDQATNFGRLRNRGLEQIRYLYALDEGEDTFGFLTDYPGCMLINAIWLEAQGHTLLRSAVKSAVRLADDIHAGLLRSIRRHGPFESSGAALDFVAAALQRVERRMDRERAIAKVRPRLDSGVQMAGSAL